MCTGYLYYSLIVLLICVRSVVILPVSFMILVTCISSLSCFISLTTDLPVSFHLVKELALCFIALICCFTVFKATDICFYLPALSDTALPGKGDGTQPVYCQEEVTVHFPLGQVSSVDT